jgi:signal transduction histidine kinase
VEADGGKISLESQLGQGGCFRVQIPLHNKPGDVNQIISG